MSAQIIQNLRQSWPLPSSPVPIVIIGAGGIVNDAHLPAYRKAGFPIAGIYDINPDRARATATKFGIANVFSTLTEAMETRSPLIYDVAVPPGKVLEVLENIPHESAILIQKPMGSNLGEARQIHNVCQRRDFIACLNFQLRFSPMMLALHDAIDRGLLGSIVDVEMRLNLRTPWELFPFLAKMDRVEILLHSIHYLDLIRSILGEPVGVYARTIGHPSSPLKNTRTSVILNYGDHVRCCLSLNHHFEFGPAHESATLTVQGLDGAAVVSLGLLLNYPTGKPETLEITTRTTPWTNVPIEGRWFPDGFIGRMANLQRFIEGEDDILSSNTADSLKTMALVEACYNSSAEGGTPIEQY